MYVDIDCRRQNQEAGAINGLVCRGTSADMPDNTVTDLNIPDTATGERDIFEHEGGAGFHESLLVFRSL